MPIILVGESLEELERHLEALKKLDAVAARTPKPSQKLAAPTSATSPRSVQPTDAPAKATSPVDLSRQVQRLKHRVTRTTGKVWDLVVAAASRPEGSEFSLTELAESMKERHSRVLSWHRILARPCKRLHLTVLSKIEGTERPVKFTVPIEMRTAVLSVANVKSSASAPKQRRRPKRK